MSRLALLVVAIAGCQPDAPSSPSFQQDVLPILAANCVRCHGYPAIGGSPETMRLDVYGDVAVDDDTILTGAASNAFEIARRVASPDRPMPPRFPLDDYQIETLQNWAADVVPGEAPPRGEPRPDNQAPEIAVERLGEVDGVVALESWIDDLDGDLVAGELRVTIDGVERVAGPVRSGRVEVHWDTTGVPPGDHPLAAHIDDGAELHVVALGTITVGAP